MSILRILLLALALCVPDAHAQRVRRASGAPQWTYSATAFSGSGQYLSRGQLNGSQTNSSGTISVWFRSGANGALQRMISVSTASGSIYVGVLKQANNTLLVRMINSDSTGGGQVRTVSTVTDTAWHHIYVSLDLSADTNYRVFWFDGAPATVEWITWSDTDIAWNKLFVGIGASHAGAEIFTGALSEVAIYPGSGFRNPATYLAAFRSTAGKPVNLGPTGSAPWGQTPIYYGHGPLLSDTSGNNQTFTVNGPPTDSADKP